MLHRIVTGIVIADIARKEKFDKRPDIREKMDHMINNFLTIEYLDKVIAAKAKAPDEDILKYYKENSDRFIGKARVRARHILIKTEKMHLTLKGQMPEKKAEGILLRLRDGEDFEALASDYSDDEKTKDSVSVSWARSSFRLSEKILTNQIFHIQSYHQ